MKRLATLATTAALAGALLLGGTNARATTTYAMYMQPVSGTTVGAGPNSTFTFRVLIDIPPLSASNNGTLALTVGAAFTYDANLTGPTVGFPNSRSKFKFVPDKTDFAPLAALGAPGTATWDLVPPSAFSTTSNGVFTFQGGVGHSKQYDPNDGVTPLLIPAGTYTIGTYTIPILSAGSGSMTIQFPTAFGYSGPNATKNFINNISTNGTTTITNDGVLTFPNDGVTHFNAITIRTSGVSVSGRIAWDGITDLRSVSPNAPLNPVTLEAGYPQENQYGQLFTVWVDIRTLTLTPDPANPGFANYSTGVPNVPIEISYFRFRSGKQLTTILKNIYPHSGTVFPDVILRGGDASRDDKVDIADFGLLVNTYGSDVTIPETAYDFNADFNYDGIVDIGDLGILVNNYGAVGDR